MPRLHPSISTSLTQFIDIQHTVLIYPIFWKHTNSLIQPFLHSSLHTLITRISQLIVNLTIWVNSLANKSRYNQWIVTNNKSAFASNALYLLVVRYTITHQKIVRNASCLVILEHWIASIAFQTYQRISTLWFFTIYVPFQTNKVDQSIAPVTIIASTLLTIKVQTALMNILNIHHNLFNRLIILLILCWRNRLLNNRSDSFSTSNNTSRFIKRITRITTQTVSISRIISLTLRIDNSTNHTTLNKSLGSRINLITKRRQLLTNPIGLDTLRQKLHRLPSHLVLWSDWLSLSHIHQHIR